MKFITLTLLSLLAISCASKDSQSKINNLEVTEKLVKGKTTQTEILETFGAPEVVEKTESGDVWGYVRYANESSSVGGGATHYAGAVLMYWTGINVSGDKSSSSTKTNSLVIHFDKNKVVKNYTFRSERF
jgi:outer membrane protein assembly factor BamE (lipoprotein component of BamABCDE complex)